MSGYAKWKEAFGGQPVCVAHHADARGMDLLLDGSGPWKVRYLVFQKRQCKRMEELIIPKR